MVRRGSGTTVMVMLALVAAALMAAATWAALADRPASAVDLGIAGLAVAGVAFLVAQMSRAPRIEIGVNGGELVVRFHGWDAVWTLRRQVRIPLQEIEHVTVRHVDISDASGWRRRGTAVPGLIHAGSFAAGGRKELWDVREGAEAVEVELSTATRFHRLVLELPDPSASAERLRTAAGVR